jgi:hypothetical protein
MRYLFEVVSYQAVLGRGGLLDKLIEGGFAKWQGLHHFWLKCSIYRLCASLWRRTPLNLSSISYGIKRDMIPPS